MKASIRDGLPDDAFGLSKARKYPINVPGKARRYAGNAKARAAQMVKKGKLPRSDEKTIDAKANRVLRGSA